MRIFSPFSCIGVAKNALQWFGEKKDFHQKIGIFSVCVRPFLTFCGAINFDHMHDNFLLWGFIT